MDPSTSRYWWKNEEGFVNIRCRKDSRFCGYPQCRSWEILHQRFNISLVNLSRDNTFTDTYHEEVRVQIGDLDGSLHQNRVRGESELVVGTGAIHLVAPVSNPLLNGDSPG